MGHRLADRPVISFPRSAAAIDPIWDGLDGAQHRKTRVIKLCRLPERKTTVMDRQREASPPVQEPLPGDDQWYVSRNEHEYGPLRFSDLAQFAKQGRLLEHDWVWKPGLASWVAASEVSNLFVESVRLRREPRQVDRSDGNESAKPAPKSDHKKRAKDQIKSFGLMFLYL